jgi:hypothetical protein
MGRREESGTGSSVKTTEGGDSHASETAWLISGGVTLMQQTHRSEESLSTARNPDRYVNKGVGLWLEFACMEYKLI